jgi:hypothetical protein
MKKIILLSTVFLAFSIEAHGMVKKVVKCPNVNEIKRELNNALEEAQNQLNQKLGVKSGDGKLTLFDSPESTLSNIQGQPVHLHTTDTTCVVRIGNQKNPIYTITVK